MRTLSSTQLITKSRRYLLTLKLQNGVVEKKIWDGHKPLALGHPFRWIVEKTEDGVRIRSLLGAIGENYNGLIEIEEQKLSQPQEVQVQGAVITLHPVSALKPVYKSEQTDVGELNVFFCLQNSVVSTTALKNHY